MSDILCPECGHSIDQHEWDGCEWYRPSGWAYAAGIKAEECDCKSKPSHIARALLTAEPTEAEVEAAAIAWLQTKHPRPRVRMDAALRAAREARS